MVQPESYPQETATLARLGKHPRLLIELSGDALAVESYYRESSQLAENTQCSLSVVDISIVLSGARESGKPPSDWDRQEPQTANGSLGRLETIHSVGGKGDDPSYRLFEVC